MTENEYLLALVESETLPFDSEEVKALQEKRGEVEAVLRSHYGTKALTIRYGGSHAKHTMVKSSYDLDLLCYFERDNTDAGQTLKEIYDDVKQTLSAEYDVEPKRTAIRLVAKNKNQIHVDVVPGRFIDGTKTDVFLHQDDGDKNWLKTNPDKHIEHVRDSGVRKAIRLAKLWKHAAGFQIPTFILELLVVEILSESKEDSLDIQFMSILTAIADNLDNYSVSDPANPQGNDLYQIFTDEKQAELSSAARAALDAKDAADWSSVFGVAVATPDSGSRALVPVTDYAYARQRLADGSHCQIPPWPRRPGTYSARMEAEAIFQNRTRALLADGSVMTGTTFRYIVRTDVPPPFTAKWQVVNTGPDATGARGRGDFFDAKRMDGRLSSNQLVNEEGASYVGKHWIECFIIKDGVVLAQTGRFYVNINRPPRKYGRFGFR